MQQFGQVFLYQLSYATYMNFCGNTVNKVCLTHASVSEYLRHTRTESHWKEDYTLGHGQWGQLKLKKKLPGKIRLVFRKQEVAQRNDGLPYFVNIRNMKVNFFLWQIRHKIMKLKLPLWPQNIPAFHILVSN